MGRATELREYPLERPTRSRLEVRLRDLQERLHRGSYHPQPVRRVMIPKPGGKERPLGIPSLEDKVVQQAVRAILEPIYEREFLGFSYGFRPGKSAHDALDALATTVVKGRVDWVLDADIRSFFDTIDHAWMKKFIEHRIGDRRLVRLLMKWLKAGVMVEGLREETVRGAPQGGIISPLLANIYLHYVLDLWAHSWRQRDARKHVYIVRYADDFVMGFEDGRDARSMHSALRRRLSEFGLELHEDKTRVLRFGRYARERTARLGQRPGTFDFLGFTHICGVDRKNGWFQLLRHTSKKKRQATLRKLSDELRKRRHEPPQQTCKWLGRVLRGYDQYFGVPSNETVLERMRRHIRDAWLRQLRRRSQRARWTVPAIKRFQKRFPLSPTSPSSTLGLRCDSLPVDPTWEPGAGNPHAGFCPGGGPQGPSLPGPPLFASPRRARTIRAWRRPGLPERCVRLW
jgi:RNA-directed DNA polymerase